MAEDWTAIAAEAGEAIADLGFPVTLKRAGDGPRDPLDTQETIHVTKTLTAVQTKTSRSFVAAGQEITVAKTLLVSADFAPRQGDTLRIGTGDPIWYAVVRVMATAPGGQAVLYKVDLTN